MEMYEDVEFSAESLIAVNVKILDHESSLLSILVGVSISAQILINKFA